MKLLWFPGETSPSIHLPPDVLPGFSLLYFHPITLIHTMTTNYLFVPFLYKMSIIGQVIMATAIQSKIS